MNNQPHLRWQFSCMNAKITIYISYVKEKRIILRPFWIFFSLYGIIPVSLHKAIMQDLFCFQSRRNSFFHSRKCSEIVTFVLQSNHCFPFPAFRLIHPTKTTGVVSPMFSLIQPFQTGSIYKGQLLCNFFLYFFFSTTATYIVSMNEVIFGYFKFCPTVTTTMPKDRTSVIPFFSCIEWCQWTYVNTLDTKS